MIVTLFSANILRKCSWKVGALTTPIIFLLSGALFFVVTMYNMYVSPQLFGISTILIAIWCGIINDALIKSVKYSLFDTTKNMAYIPLDEDSKTKGQAAVETIGGRAGKAGGALIQQIMYSVVPHIMSHVVTIIGIVAVTIITWIFSVFKLNPKYEKAVDEMNAAQAEAQKATANN